MVSTLSPPHRQAPPLPSAPPPPRPTEAFRERVLVVGYDGSRDSRSAIADAARRIDRRGHLVIVRALDPGFGDAATRADRSAYQRAVTSLMAAVRSELDSNIPYELRVVAGDLSTALADVVRRYHGAELVVAPTTQTPGGHPSPSPQPPPPRPPLARPALARDAVEQSGVDSFPASDPPSWWAGPPPSDRRARRT